MNSRIWLAIGAVALLGPTLSFAQPGGGGFGGGGFPGGGGRGRMGGMFGDPEQMINSLFGNKTVITRNDVDPSMQWMFDMYARSTGSTTGQISKDDVRSVMARMRERMGGGMGQGGPGGPARGGAGGEDPGEARFRRLDKDGDGLLKADELPEALAQELDKWDTNPDGFIDVTEYKSYFAARVQQFDSDRNAAASGSGSPANDDSDRRPVVYRGGKLPKELPPWFAQLDTNQDGQVSLLEWRTSGRQIDEFKSMDRSGDNLLTVEETLLYVKLNKLNGSVASTSNGGGPGGFGPGGGTGMGSGSGGTGGFGSFGEGRGRGPGGGMPSFGGPGGWQGGNGAVGGPGMMRGMMGGGFGGGRGNFGGGSFGGGQDRGQGGFPWMRGRGPGGGGNEATGGGSEGQGRRGRRAGGGGE